ncbi:MAG TPA: transglycosylase SLT domain-containing protein [Longimicrobiales bacterium]
MFSRYLVIAVLFFAAAIGPALLDSRGTTAAPGPPAPEVPPEALEAMRQGRYWRASQILREYLATVPDPTPETVLLAAQAEAGWGAWAEVERLLAGQSWLDTVAGGLGWSLLGRSRLELGRFAESGDALSRYLSLAAAGDRERGLAELRRGLALLGAGDAGEALRAFDRGAERVPELGDWAAVFAARAAANAGDTATVRARLAEADPYLAREWGWRIGVDARVNAGDLRGAERAATAAANALEDSGRRAAAWVASGDLRLLLGDTAGAKNAFRRAMEAAPSAIAAVDAARKLGDLPNLSPEEQLRVGRLYLRHGNLDRARSGLAAYLASGRGTSLERGQVRLEIARSYFRQGRYREAERRLLELAASPPNDRIGAEALFLAGRAQYRQGRAADGRATFLRTAERFPKERAAAEALFLVADLDHDEGRLESAREYYRRTAAIAPTINEAGLALMRLGGLAFVEGDYERAASIFEEYRRLHPDGRRYQQATYWAAKCYERLGQHGVARERLREVRRSDPISWYGLRAAEQLGQDFWDFAMEPSPPEDPAIREEVAGALVRLDLLRELGQDAAAEFELERLKRHFLKRDGALYALAEAFNERGFTFTGIGLGWEIHEREGVWNPRLLRIIYPFPYRELIMAEARERGVDPFLVAGLIRQESMFTAEIKSPAGAIGLMQIMPSTGSALARTAGINAFRTALLEKPEINVHLGIQYMAQLMARFDDRLTSVLAAYNAGPHRVSRWSSFPEYGDEELFAERIPYAETRHYVKVVQQNARVYAALYHDADDAVAAPAGAAAGAAAGSATSPAAGAGPAPAR